jgi:hypothetical protein
MNPAINRIPDEKHLAGLAMKFRGTRRAEERLDIARDYTQTPVDCASARQS